jgi:hypothetical protein
MSVVRWEDPPPSRKPGRRLSKYWTAIADALKEHPGQWAVIHEGARQGSLVARVNGGRSAFAPAGAFEAMERPGDGMHRVYARYVGGAS